MNKTPIIAAIDIGTGVVKAIIVQKQPEETGFKVLGKAESMSAGVRKGVVMDSEKVGKIIRATISEAEKEAGQVVDKVYANINGMHIFCLSSKGLISVSRADQEIAEDDIDRVISAAKTISVPPNKEIIQIIPREFIVDKERGIKNPLGLSGVRLEAEIIALGVFTPYSNNLCQAILNADLQVEDLILDPVATARAVLTEEEKEQGVMVINIGAGTTGISIYEEGDILHTLVLPVGTNNIRNDIAVGLTVDIETAEFVKNKFGEAILGEKSAKKEKIISSSGEEVIFQLSELKKVAEPKIAEIFEEIGKELKNISRDRQLPAGVVLTGGGAKIPNIADFARKKLGLHCRIGIPRRFFPLDEDTTFSTVCGIVLCGMDIEEKEGREVNIKNTFSKVKKKFFRFFLP
jgi:cell division protein FtsA